MRILVVVLALISVTLAGTTVYFARELRLERELTPAMPVVAQAAPAMPGQFSRPRVTPLPIGPRANTPQSVNTEAQESPPGKLQTDHSRRVLRMLENPEEREGMLVETKMMMRNSYPRIAQTIGLSSEESERLFTLLALQQMDAQERYARCTLEPGCNLADGTGFQNDPRAREITELLGADRQQQFESYKNTLMERESVTHLRTRLSDASRLPDASAEALISVLADERQKIHQEAAARGVGMNGYGTGVGVIFSASDASTAEAQFASAQANSQRMRERAAEVLTGEQLRVFNEMQDELLISLKHQVRQKEEFISNSSVSTATVVN
jgi:hypothetical protein